LQKSVLIVEMGRESWMVGQESEHRLFREASGGNVGAVEGTIRKDVAKLRCVSTIVCALNANHMLTTVAIYDLPVSKTRHLSNDLRQKAQTKWLCG
jgi:hypothetical protein